MKFGTLLVAAAAATAATTAAAPDAGARAPAHTARAPIGTGKPAAVKPAVGAAASCSSPPPGFEIFEVGYDLSTLDPLDPDAMGWKRPAIQISCASGATYENQYNHKTYQIPDQLSGEPQASGGVVTDAFSILVNMSQYYKAEVAQTITTSAFWGLFSHTTTIANVFQFLANESVYVGLQSSHVSAYDMALVLPLDNALQLSDDCQMLMDALPATFGEDTVDAFEEVIDVCGTHYLTQATMGCKLQYQHLTGIGKLDVMDQGDVALNAGLDFLQFLRAIGAVSGNGTAAADDYLNITLNTTTCYGGGTACPYDPASYQQWLADCPEAPVFIKGQFNFLDTLVKNNATTAANFRLAANNHFNRAFLEHEFIPLMQVALAVVNSEVAFNDTGGDCGGGSCPLDGTVCDPTDPASWSQCKCDGRSHGCGQFGNFSCPNAVVNGGLNATAAALRGNITQWNTELSGLITQAQAALQNNKIVAKATLALMTAQFVFYMSRVQLPVTKQTCGFNFTQYETPCSGCQAAAGAFANAVVNTRNLSYIPIF